MKKVIENKIANSNLGGGQILLNNKMFCRTIIYMNTA